MQALITDTTQLKHTQSTEAGDFGHSKDDVLDFLKDL